jgi:LEA14-like dessication related protein
MRPLSVRALPALLSFSAGCAALSGPGDVRAHLNPFLPEVSFVRLDLRRVDFQKAEVAFVFDVKNPNPLEVRLSSFRYALAFEGSQVLSGDDPDGLTLKAQGASAVSLPVTLVYEELYRAIKATRGEDEIGFTLSGEFGFKTPLGEVRLPFSEQGKFPAPRPPKITVRQLRVAKPDLLRQTVRAELELAVENDHASEIAFRSFRYEISLGGAPAAQGSIDKIDPVAGASEQLVALPIEINLGGLGAALARAIAPRSTLSLRLAATLEVGTPFGILPLAIDKSQEIQLR